MSEVNFFERSLRNIIDIFNSNNIKYMIIGGLANAKWGMPRATLDIDITIWIPDHAIEDLISLLTRDYVVLVDNPLEFVSETRVLPIKSKTHQRIDLIFGSLPFEKNAIDRAVKVKIGKTSVYFCTAEDLILLKIISDRQKDIEDVRGILKFQKEKIDFNYLEPRIEELANLLDRPDLKQQWKKWKNEEGL
jgi:hypothetical protein